MPGAGIRPPPLVTCGRSAHPAVAGQAIALVIDLAVAVEADPDEPERRLLDAIVRADEDRALVAAHGASHVVVALQRWVVDHVARQHVQLDAARSKATRQR
jgi:hypothetical protein